MKFEDLKEQGVNYISIIVHDLRSYLDDETKSCSRWHGYSFALRHRQPGIDEKTLKKLKKALDIEDD